MRILTADIGSTFTKLMALDTDSRRILGAAKAFTTIETNVMNGFNSALDELSRITGITGVSGYDKLLAASSAAGGLKMVSCGLVPDLTAKASRLAAASAGAKVVKTFSYELTRQEKDEIRVINPDIILLSGGIDGGNKDVIIKNAGTLAELEGNFSVIVAGNKTALGEISEILEKGGKEAIICRNVMPEFGKLDILPAKIAIRDLFIKNIISAKGLSELQELMDAEIIPTPLAVMNAFELLSGGTENEPGLGELMAFDVGGATTDVYSMAEGSPSKPNVALHGLPEPYAKRTVEGDIGMRYSVLSLAEEAGTVRIAREAGVSEDEVLAWIEKCSKNPSTVPEAGTPENSADEALAALAVEISSERHAGVVEKTYSVMGEMLIQTGKDLTGVKCVIGTGGQLVNSRNPRGILEKAIYSLQSPLSLKPLEPRLLLDSKYCFSSMGLLCGIDADAAINMMKTELREI